MNGLNFKIYLMLVAVQLGDDQLWRRFAEIQNEMIITRSGRCLFPLYKLRMYPIDLAMPPGGDQVQVIRLIDGHRYSVGMTIQQVDSMRWRFRNGKWHPTLSGGHNRSSSASSDLASSSQEQAQPSSTCQVYEPFEGTWITADDLLSLGVSFAKVKLTNLSTATTTTTTTTTRNSFSLASFHKYIPVVWIFDHDWQQDYRPLSQIITDPARANQGLQRITFPWTDFIAVTHYQNDQVTRLKKSHNPHAKGFASDISSYAPEYVEVEGQEEAEAVDLAMNQDELLATQSLVKLMASPH